MLRKTCRVCAKALSPFMSFGKMPLANAFTKPEHLKDEYFFELAPGFCTSCFTFQLMEQPDPSHMFHDHYAFFSGTSQHMARHFEAMANDLRTFLTDQQDPLVVELGSNDGIMLQHFARLGVRHVGVEPSENVVQVARDKGIQTVCAFFNPQTAEDIRKQHGPAQVISAANVMCHIPNMQGVAKAVDHLLAKEGVFVFEDPYLGSMIEKTSYDQLYDAHVYIFSVHAVHHIFASVGLTLFHVEPQPTHGGSMRYYLCRTGQHPRRETVDHYLHREKEQGLTSLATFRQFRQACEQNRADFRAMLQAFQSQGKRVVGYAAAAKSTTVLNYCDIGPDLIEYIADTTPIKQGTVTPGMHIPVRSFEGFYDNPPDVAVLFAWNHAKEIFAKEKHFLERGGQWLLFRPHVHKLTA